MRPVGAASQHSVAILALFSSPMSDACRLERALVQHGTFRDNQLVFDRTSLVSLLRSIGTPAPHLSQRLLQAALQQLGVAEVDVLPCTTVPALLYLVGAPFTISADDWSGIVLPRAMDVLLAERHARPMSQALVLVEVDESQTSLTSAAMTEPVSPSVSSIVSSSDRSRVSESSLRVHRKLGFSRDKYELMDKVRWFPWRPLSRPRFLHPAPGPNPKGPFSDFGALD